MVAGLNNAALPDGLALGRYRIVKKIAAGGSSIVYLAQDGDGAAVAIKEYLPASLARRDPGMQAPVIEPGQLDLFRQGLSQFIAEGRALAAIAHPNVVRVRDVFSANDTVYLVTDYLRGRSLQQHITLRRRQGDKPLVSEPALRSLFMQVMDALREVHTHRLLHLDLKPANIWLRPDGSPVLLDFGAARQALHADFARLHTMYTPGFAGPEMYTRRELGPWTDIYGIGAAIFTCMLGVPPQSAIERKRNDRMDMYLQGLSELYSAELLGLVRRSLALDPLARPQSVYALQKLIRPAS